MAVTPLVNVTPVARSLVVVVVAATALRELYKCVQSILLLIEVMKVVRANALLHQTSLNKIDQEGR